MSREIESLVRPRRVWRRSETLTRPSPVPQRSGVYAWYFRVVPPEVPTTGCVLHDAATLLYVGIAPREPSPEGSASAGNLRSRIRTHYARDASRSTLRLSLGCLLVDTLDIKLHVMGSDQRVRFSDEGETILSEWMAENAFVCWIEHPRPWDVEDEAIETLDLPFNLRKNAHHSFHASLTHRRDVARAEARSTRS